MSPQCYHTAQVSRHVSLLLLSPCFLSLISYWGTWGWGSVVGQKNNSDLKALTHAQVLKFTQTEKLRNKPS
uniref:Uncharacterized protein n=1 Tax=Anguilla anguilla TaxID=7936 RepID=A0A0E9RAE6_ANGAN